MVVSLEKQEGCGEASSPTLGRGRSIKRQVLLTSFTKEPRQEETCQGIIMENSFNIIKTPP